MKTTPPQKFDIQDPSFCKETVQKVLKRDGAVVLTNVFPSESTSSSCSSSWQAIAATVPRLVWDSSDLLLEQHQASPVHEEHRKLSLAGEALHPHSDGYIWGDQFPDLVILVCEQPAGDEGQGANYLIDGHHVVERLDEAQREFLTKTLVDHTERLETAFVNGAESIVPVIRWLAPQGWRCQIEENHVDSEALPATSHLCWRRMVNKSFAGKQVKDETTGNVHYASLWAPVQGDDQEDLVMEALLKVDKAIAVEEDQALRFALKKGEALVVDNYRMLHAREAFHGLDENRRMWRIWSWTNASFGLPPQVAASSQSKTDLPSNILEAEQSIQANA